MDWLSVVILVIILVDAVSGFRRGLVRQVLDLLGAIIGLIAAFRLYGAAAGFILRYFVALDPTIAKVMGFVSVFIAVAVVIEALGYGLSLFMRLPGLSVVNSLSGAFFGAIRSTLVITIILALLIALRVPGVSAAVERSPVATRLLSVAPIIYEQFERAVPKGVTLI